MIAIQRRQSEEYRSSHGLPDQAALESAVFLPQAGYCGELTEEAAALLESLLNHHAFVAGNKRVGFAAARTVLLANGFDLGTSPARRQAIHDQNDRGRQVSLCADSRLDCSASWASSGRDFRERPRRTFGFARFWEDFHR